MIKCEMCGRFHSGEPGSAWMMVYQDSEPYQQLTRCVECVRQHGHFIRQSGIKAEHSCGIVTEVCDD